MAREGFDRAELTSPGLPRADDRSFDHICRLVPGSGLQFIDTFIDAAGLSMMRTWFTEDDIESAAGSVRRVLLPLANDANMDGTIWHPLTFKPLTPSQTLSLNGLEALEPFLDAWVPVPFFRYLGKTAEGRARFDTGPANWARVFIAKPAKGLRTAERLEAVFAFDTRLDMRSRPDQSSYLAPNSDDALFASTFMLAETPDDLADFLSCEWIDTWLANLCRAHSSTSGHADLEEAGFAVHAKPSDAFTFGHIARYLTLIKILKRQANPPQIRFLDSISKTMPVTSTAMDLIIDFDASETTALLLARQQNRNPVLSLAARKGAALRVRNLTNPVEVHVGAIPTQVEFDNQSFGDGALSRRSGRPDAFAWSSLVRIGHEARRLALRANATEGVTGLSDLGGGLADSTPSEVLWRFSTADGVGNKPGRMVTGASLQHLSESGDADLSMTGQIEADDDASGGVLIKRPRFSHSALVGFFVVELLLHAVSQINSVTSSAVSTGEMRAANEIRLIERIILTSSLSLSSHERQLLIERVNTAIELVWRAQQWDRTGPANAVPRPQLVLGLGTDVGHQLAYLFTEVRQTFAGSFTNLVDCTRRRTGDVEARDSLRIASIDLGRRSARFTIVDYEAGHDGSVAATVVAAHETAWGESTIVEALLQSAILPCIAERLRACGIGDPDGLIADYLGRDSQQTHGDGHSRRLMTKVLQPAASALFKAFVALPSKGAQGVRSWRLDHLVNQGDGRLGGSAAHFEATAARAGAAGFKLVDVVFELGQWQIKRLIEGCLWPVVDTITAAIAGSESDLLLLAGPLGDMPDIVERVLWRSAVPVGRTIIGSSENDRDLQAPMDPANENHKQRVSALLAGYLASRNMLIEDGFAIVTAEISRLLSSEIKQTSIAAPSSSAGVASSLALAKPSFPFSDARKGRTAGPPKIDTDENGRPEDRGLSSQHEADWAGSALQNVVAGSGR